MVLLFSFHVTRYPLIFFFFVSTDTNLFLNRVNIPTPCFLLFDVVFNEMLKELEELVVRAVFLSFFCT